MIYFTNDRSFIIVPTDNITEEMKNCVRQSFDLKGHSLRVSVDRTKTLFKLKQPVSAVFNDYRWYNQRDILIELAKAEWNIDA